MISIKTAMLTGAVVIGLAGITAYASGTFCTTETAQTQPTQAIFTSGGAGGDNCCAADKATAMATAHNATFTPKVQTAALEGGACPYDAKQQAALTAKGESCGATATAAALAKSGQSCDATTTATTASLASNDQSCCATDKSKTATSKTNLAVVVPTAKTN